MHARVLPCLIYTHVRAQCAGGCGPATSRHGRPHPHLHNCRCLGKVVHRLLDVRSFVALGAVCLSPSLLPRCLLRLLCLLHRLMSDYRMWLPPCRSFCSTNCSSPEAFVAFVALVACTFVALCHQIICRVSRICRKGSCLLRLSSDCHQ